ncbi:unnamed protein product [Chironomus riparius]|uniref:Uncharacterized protein n=1 Tax=Chironomus riparius TaxID=315576 RepID=A0A9N9S4D5_9DIPT|nr:unnamed protein product [Chironomus riparius]
MNPRELILINLKRQDLDYAVKVREALIHADDALRKKDIVFGRQIISEIIFMDNKTSRLNRTQELQLIVALLTDFFTRDDPTRLGLFFNIFEVGKNSRKFILIKFIIISIALQNGPALNAVGTYLLDSSLQEIRIAADLNRLLINEITYYSNNSLAKLKSLPTLSPLFTNSLCLIFAETYKDTLPTQIIGELITEFMTLSPFIYIFNIPSHVEVGAFLLGTFFRWTVLSELYEEAPSLSKLHLKILECLSSVDIKSPSKPIVYTKFLEVIIDQILKASKVIDPEKIQKSLEKFAQLIQISKSFLYGNIPLLMDRLKTLPKNPLMELVLRLS